jgi:predicted Zn-dependent protease
MRFTRRDFVQLGMCGCASCFFSATVSARVPESSLEPLIGTDYQPAAADERGLWYECDRLEQQILASNLLIKDTALLDYLRGVLTRLLGDYAARLRVYVVRDPDFNAAMFPNGMTMVHTGLLVRLRSEAQLAAVLGHEAGHFLRCHTVKSWRDHRSKSAAAAFFGIAAGAATGATGTNWYNLANAISNSLLLSMLSYDRTLESEADAFGLKLMHAAKYPASAASEVWDQLIRERKASAAARKERYKDRSASAFSTHPPNEQRMHELRAYAISLARVTPGADHFDAGRAQYIQAIRPYRFMLLNEQIKLNDTGASIYLVNNLAQDGWDGVLRFYEGECYRIRGQEGDSALAAQAYAASVAFEDAPPEAFRAYGYAQLRGGQLEEGRRALQRYLEMSPNAPDAAMVRYTLNQ